MKPSMALKPLVSQLLRSWLLLYKLIKMIGVAMATTTVAATTPLLQKRSMSTPLPMRTTGKPAPVTKSATKVLSTKPK